MKCTHPRQVLIRDRWICRDCDFVGAEKRRRGLTPWESLKLSFYRSNKKWEDHIRDRHAEYKNGKKYLVSNGREIPNQPQELLPPPKIKYIRPNDSRMSPQ